MKSMKRYFVEFSGFVFILHVREKVCTALICFLGLLHFAISPERLAAATRPEHANVSPKRKKKSRGGV